MKKLIFPTILACTMITVSCAQKPSAEVYKQMYRSALQYADWPTAASALHGLLATEGESEAVLWRDSLAYVYFNMSAYGACEKLCSEVLEDRPESLSMVEILAVSQRSMGKNKAAADNYAKLLQQTSNVFHAYHLAELQFGMDSLAQCLLTIQIAERLEAPETAWVQVPITQTQTQSAPIRAAVYFLKGLVLQTLNEKENQPLALEAYDKAIELFPDFVLAKNNRGVLMSLK